MIPLTLGTIAKVAAGRVLAGSPDRSVTRVVTNSKDVRVGDLFVAIVGERRDGHAYVEQAFRAGAAGCLVGRDIPVAPDVLGDGGLIVTSDPVAALGRLAAFYRDRVMDAGTRVIAVTGSNGKTTTKHMIDHVLSARFTGRASPRSFNNHIGVPLTLLSACPGDDYLVVEIGSNAPGEVAALAQMASPDVGVITSVGAAHLEGFGDLHAVAAEKASLIDEVRDGGMVVINGDQPVLMEHVALEPGVNVMRDAAALGPVPQCLSRLQRSAAVGGPRDSSDAVGFGLGGVGQPDGVVEMGVGGVGTRGSVWSSPRRLGLVTVGTSPHAQIHATALEGDLDGTSFLLDGDLAVRLSVPGVHHAMNAALAYAVGRLFGMDGEQIGARLYSFAPVTGRTRRVELEGLTLIDDCYNANPSSVSAALELLGGVGSRRRVVVLGDMLELGADSEVWHRSVGRSAARAGVSVLVAVGPRSRAMAEAAAASGVGEIALCDDAAGASAVLLPRLRSGDVVLVKGSRAVGLESVVQAVCDRFSPSSPVGNRVARRRAG